MQKSSRAVLFVIFRRRKAIPLPEIVFAGCDTQTDNDRHIFAPDSAHSVHRSRAARMVFADVNLSSIADLDLCVILGNLLDNALAAAAQSTERKIYCSFGQKNQYYSAITIINSCDTTPAMKNGIPQRQTPSEQHGFGAENEYILRFEMAEE